MTTFFILLKLKGGHFYMIKTLFITLISLYKQQRNNIVDLNLKL